MRRELAPFGRACALLGTCVSLLGAAPGCARPNASTTPAPDAAKEAEVTRMREALRERDDHLRQLEGRLALMEAEQRQFRYQLEDQREATPAPVPIELPKAPAKSEARPAREPAQPEEPRMLLKLHGDEREPSQHIRVRESVPLQDVPIVRERLPVVPLPSTTPVLLHSAPPRALPTPVADETYSAALDALGARDFRSAALLFDRFVSEHPGDTRIGKASYWRAEALFALRNFESARRGFEAYLGVAPRGDRAADAWLKLGHCRLRLGDRDGARAAFTQLRREFPGSPAARMAAEEEL